MEIKNINEKTFRGILSQLIDVYLDGYKDMKEYAYRTRGDAKRYLKWLYHCDPHSFFIAEENENILGFISGARSWWDKTFGEVGEIHELVVRSNHQSKGIGTKLMEQEISHLSKYHGTIGLWVGENNYRAMKFYEKFGFKEVGRVGIWVRMIRRD